MQHLFDEAVKTQKCPKCCGFVIGPQWEGTAQGKVYTIHCVNCGWRENSQDLVIDYSMPSKELPGHITKMKRATRGMNIIKVRKLDLTQYNWGE